MKKNIEFIIDLIFFFMVSVPLGVCFYLANEIFFLFKKPFK